MLACKIALMDTALLNILVCPLCHGDLAYCESSQELLCSVDELAYPIREDIPVLLVNQARSLSVE